MAEGRQGIAYGAKIKPININLFGTTEEQFVKAIEAAGGAGITATQYGRADSRYSTVSHLRKMGCSYGYETTELLFRIPADERTAWETASATTVVVTFPMAIMGIIVSMVPCKISIMQALMVMIVILMYLKKKWLGHLSIWAVMIRMMSP